MDAKGAKQFELKKDNTSEAIKALVFELYKMRKLSRLTQIDLSKKTGLPQATISRVESFNGEPTLDTLVKIADALGMNLSIALSPKLDYSENLGQQGQPGKSRRH